jgi:ribosomal protein S12 methylthiotransferase accessory factor
MDTIKVTFPGGKRVDAEYGGFTFNTDQARDVGGEGSAPPPFDLFLASIATCAGIYVKGYCDARGLATGGLGLAVHVEREPGKARVVRIAIEIRLPPGFPEKHKEAVIRAADLCAVKKHIFDPPRFEIRTV